MKVQVHEMRIKIVLLMLLLTILYPIRTFAAPAPVNTTAPCTVSFAIHDSDGTSVSGGSVCIYRVADWNISGEYCSWTLTEAYASCDVRISSPEDAEAAAALLTYTNVNHVAGTEKQLDEAGQVSFTDLSAGLYLVAQPEPATEHQAFSPFLLELPHYDVVQARYLSTITASPKMEPTPEIVPKLAVIEGSKPPIIQTVADVPLLRTTSATGLPKTGQLWWPVPVLMLCGMVFIALAWRLRKRSGGQDG